MAFNFTEKKWMRGGNERILIFREEVDQFVSYNDKISVGDKLSCESFLYIDDF